MQLRRLKMRVCGMIIYAENALIILMDLANQTIEGRLISVSVAAGLLYCKDPWYSQAIHGDTVLFVSTLYIPHTDRMQLPYITANSLPKTEKHSSPRSNVHVP